MTPATDTDIRDIKTAIDANTKAIGDMVVEIKTINSRLVEIDRKVDKIDSRIDNLETKIEAKIDKLEIKLDGKFEKLDERTKLGFWGFILRGLVLTALIGVGTYLLPVVAEYVHKLPPL